MGRRSSTGGVTPIGQLRIQFDFTVDGVRYRPTLPWIPHEANLRRARARLIQIKARIAAGTFSFAEDFPRFRFRHALPVLLRARTCGEVFDAFLQHEAQRVARDDLAPVTLAAHTQILDAVWRPAIGALPFLGVRYSTLVKVADTHRWTKKTYNNAISALRRAFDFGFQDHPEHHNPATALRSARISKKDRPAPDPFSIQDAETLIAAIHRDWGEAQGNYDEFRFFTGLRPSEQMALVVTDYDARSGLLSVNKARVAGVDRDRTKTREDRRVVLCPRARAVLERQLRLRERLAREGRLDHACLFCHTDGAPIRRHSEVYGHWHTRLKRLAIRYRKPYAARHSSEPATDDRVQSVVRRPTAPAQHPHDAHRLCGVDRRRVAGGGRVDSARDAQIRVIRTRLVVDLEDPASQVPRRCLGSSPLGSPPEPRIARARSALDPRSNCSG